MPTLARGGQVVRGVWLKPRLQWAQRGHRASQWPFPQSLNIESEVLVYVAVGITYVDLGSPRTHIAGMRRTKH